jgi:hypothetical protein
MVTIQHSTSQQGGREGDEKEEGDKGERVDRGRRRKELKIGGRMG